MNIGGSANSDAAGGRGGQGINVVIASYWLDWNCRARPSKIWDQIAANGCGAGWLSGFKRPLLFGLVNDAEVIDAGIGLRGLAGAHEIGNSHCRQQADNGHDNHDFNQGEACLGVVSNFFHGSTFFTCHGGTKQSADLYDDIFCSKLPTTTAIFLSTQYAKWLP